MSSAQRRFGPFNIGVFGLLASIINGLNLLFVQSFFIMSSYSLVMFSLPLLFLLVLLLLFSLIMPLYLMDVYFSFFVFVLASSLLIFIYFLLSYSSFSKYSIIGSFRIVIQFLAFGLVFDIILAIFSYLYSASIFSVSSIYSLTFFGFASTLTSLSLASPTSPASSNPAPTSESTTPPAKLYPTIYVVVKGTLLDYQTAFRNLQQLQSTWPNSVASKHIQLDSIHTSTRSLSWYAFFVLPSNHANSLHNFVAASRELYDVSYSTSEATFYTLQAYSEHRANILTRSYLPLP